MRFRRDVACPLIGPQPRTSGHLLRKNAESHCGVECRAGTIALLRLCDYGSIRLARKIEREIVPIDDKVGESGCRIVSELSRKPAPATPSSCRSRRLASDRRRGEASPCNRRRPEKAEKVFSSDALSHARTALNAARTPHGTIIVGRSCFETNPTATLLRPRCALRSVLLGNSIIRLLPKAIRWTIITAPRSPIRIAGWRMPTRRRPKSLSSRRTQLTFGYLAKLPGREAIKKQLTDLWNYEKFGGFHKAGNHYFYFHNSGLQNQSVVYVMDSLTGSGARAAGSEHLSQGWDGGAGRESR